MLIAPPMPAAPMPQPMPPAPKAPGPIVIEDAPPVPPVMAVMPAPPAAPAEQPMPAVPVPGPPPAAWEPIAIEAPPPGPMPIGANDDRKPSAKSRSLPGCSSRPANRARKPRCRGAAIRSSMVVTTCSAVARPKRARSAAGIKSLFSIVPVASPSAMSAPLALDSRSVKVSSPSSCASSSTATDTVFRVSPAANDSVPDAAV